MPPATTAAAAAAGANADCRFVGGGGGGGRGQRQQLERAGEGVDELVGVLWLLFVVGKAGGGY